tara:strand:- start:41 stop:487 length:447 start_codon:yes stop_codon:yes gene_type:complete
MKHSDIDKRIEELTAEARELERQRETLAALDVCNAQGHEVVIHDIIGTLTDVSAIGLRCRVCGARAHFCPAGDVDGEPWRLFDLENNEVAKVADFYETEPTEPLPEPEPVRTAPAEPKDEPQVIRDDGTMQTVDETESTGFYRVKFGG